MIPLTLSPSQGRHACSCLSRKAPVFGGHRWVAGGAAVGALRPGTWWLSSDCHFTVGSCPYCVLPLACAMRQSFVGLLSRWLLQGTLSGQCLSLASQLAPSGWPACHLLAVEQNLCHPLFPKPKQSLPSVFSPVCLSSALPSFFVAFLVSCVYLSGH